MFQLPEGYTVYSVSNNGNELIAYKDDSTSANPHFIVLNRTAPAWIRQSGRFSVGTVRVRVVRGLTDLDGNPIESRVLVDAQFNVPVGHDPEVAPLLADFLAMVNQEDGFEEFVTKRFFPCSPCEVTDEEE